MLIPLYRNEQLPVKRGNDSNTGLWYDKFCSAWKNNGGNWEIEKNNWIKTVVGEELGNAQLIKDIFERLTRLVLQRNGKVRFFRTDSRFVTGIGREHPVENGFTWHPLLGLPFLPGSSVKGMVRAWAENWLSADKELVSRIFGPEGEGSKAAGTVVFFDALPDESVRLEADVMTPQYSGYYKKDGGPPADWYSPVPIPFLTVAEGQTFVFAMAPRRTGHIDDTEDMKKACEWLEQLLPNIGAGAKTAVGYGRFVPDVDKEKEWNKRFEEEKKASEVKKQEREKQQKLVSLTPVRREMEQDGYSDKPDVFMSHLSSKWLSRMEGAAPEEAKEIAELLETWYKNKIPEQWQKPNKKNKEKLARIRKVLGN